MNLIIPFTKDIKFKTNIGEILSVSLEHDYTVNNSEILGNFTISGDYKAHEVSVNKDHFEHVLPFSVELNTRVDSDSVDFTVEDFTYEVIDKDTLRVNIEYSVNALEVIDEDREEETTLDDLLEEMDEELKDENVEEVVEEEKEEDTREEKEIPEETKNTILDSMNDKDDVFVTYHIHVMSETETIESICLKYNTSTNILSEYNDLEGIAAGDKIIIPEIDE